MLRTSVEKKMMIPKIDAAPCKSPCHDGQIARQRETAADRSPERQHDQSHAQTGSGIDSEHRRTGQRIAEHGLQHQARNGQCSAGQQSHDRLRQARLEHDIAPRRLRSLSAGQYGPHLGERYADRSEKQVGRPQQHDGRHGPKNRTGRTNTHGSNGLKYRNSYPGSNSGWKTPIRSRSRRSGWIGVSSK